jgi:hypothetical protein
MQGLTKVSPEVNFVLPEVNFVLPDEQHVTYINQENSQNDSDTHYMQNHDSVLVSRKSRDLNILYKSITMILAILCIIALIDLVFNRIHNY